jgi:hypothetical protein
MQEPTIDCKVIIYKSLLNILISIMFSFLKIKNSRFVISIWLNRLRGRPKISMSSWLKCPHGRRKISVWLKCPHGRPKISVWLNCPHGRPKISVWLKCPCGRPKFKILPLRCLHFFS